MLRLAARGPSPFVAALVLAGLTASTAADPNDELMQSASLVIAPGEIELHLELAPGSQAMSVFLAALDGNADRYVSGAEAQVFAKAVLVQLRLEIDQRAVPWHLTEIDLPSYEELEAGHDTLRLHAAADHPVDEGEHVLSFRNDYQFEKSRSVATIFERSLKDWAVRVTGEDRSDDGRELIVSYVAAQVR